MTFPLMPSPAINFSAPTRGGGGVFSSTSNLTTYTSGALNITEPPDPRRYAAITVLADRTGALPVSATIAGVSATLLASAQGMAMFTAPCPTGTTAVASVTWASAQSRCLILMGSRTGLQNPLSTVSVLETTGTSTVASMNLPCAHNGVISSAVLFSSGASVTWDAFMTEGFDGTNGNSQLHSNANFVPTLNETRTVTATNTVSSTWRMLSICVR